MIVYLLLAAALAIVVWFIRDDRHELEHFKALTDTAARQRRYRIWLAKAFAIFLCSSLGGLALIGRLDGLSRLPDEFAPLAAMVPHTDHDQSTMLTGMAVGAIVAGSALALVLTKRKRGAKLMTLGDVEAILPRNRAELVYGALLSLNAGVTEELFFRVFLPLLIVLATGNALFAFVAATLIFGIIHLYQGVVGVVATTVLGAVFAGVYLATGSIWIAVAAHVLIDLNGLVLRPIVSGAWRA